MADKTTTGIERGGRETTTPARQDPSWTATPFRMLERLADEIDGVFDDFGVGRSWFPSRLRHGPRPGAQSGASASVWVPAIDIHQQNHEFVVRADLPGLKKDDVCIDITDQDITLSGERRQEQETKHEGVYRSERSYGSFRRTIPLPEGAIADQATATFKDGVLEIKMPAPPEQVTRGRRLEIKEGTDARK
jgi:HSP20 family protein